MPFHQINLVSGRVVFLGSLKPMLWVMESGGTEWTSPPNLMGRWMKFHLAWVPGAPLMASGDQGNMIIQPGSRKRCRPDLSDPSPQSVRLDRALDIV